MSEDVYVMPDAPIEPVLGSGEEITPLAAQHFQLIIVSSSRVSLLLVPFPTDWFWNFEKGQSDPYGGIPIYMMGGVQIPL